jgi:hypothetical protein
MIHEPTSSPFVVPCKGRRSYSFDSRLELPIDCDGRTRTMRSLAWVAGAVALVNSGLGATTSDCVFSPPDSPDRVYDLSGLSGRDFAVPSPDHKFDYVLSVCGPVKNPPKMCEALAAKHPVAAFQMTPTWCFYLGRASNPAVWVEDGSSELGFDLVYQDGEPCANGRRREIRYHFICAERYDASIAPHFVVETPEKCHYNVTWPSRYGCPSKRSDWSSWWGQGGTGPAPMDTPSRPASSGGGWLTSPVLFGWSFADMAVAQVFGFLVYLVVGCVWNLRLGRAPGWSSCPNSDTWQALLRCILPASLAQRLGVVGRGGAAAAGGGGLFSGWFRRWQPAQPSLTATGASASSKAQLGLAEADGGVFGGEDELLQAQDDFDLFQAELEADRKRSHARGGE